MTTVSFVGAVLVELSDGRPEDASAWALLLVGAAFLGLVAGGAVFPAIKWVLYKLGRIGRPQLTRRRVGTAAAIVLTVGLAYVTVPPALRAVSRAVFGCPQTTELTVLTSPGGLAPTIEVVEGYEQWTASRDGGCAAVNAYVYATPDVPATAAVSRDWAAEDNNSVNPARDIGPRPDVWFPDSDVDLLRLDERIRTREIAENTTTPSHRWSWPSPPAPTGSCRTRHRRGRRSLRGRTRPVSGSCAPIRTSPCSPTWRRPPCTARPGPTGAPSSG